MKANFVWVASQIFFGGSSSCLSTSGSPMKHFEAFRRSFMPANRSNICPHWVLDLNAATKVTICFRSNPAKTDMQGSQAKTIYSNSHKVRTRKDNCSCGTRVLSVVDCRHLCYLEGAKLFSISSILGQFVVCIC